jgi:hypothetical protein
VVLHLLGGAVPATFSHVLSLLPMERRRPEKSRPFGLQFKANAYGDWGYWRQGRPAEGQH